MLYMNTVLQFQTKCFLSKLNKTLMSEADVKGAGIIYRRWNTKIFCRLLSAESTNIFRVGIHYNWRKYYCTTFFEDFSKIKDILYKCDCFPSQAQCSYSSSHAWFLLCVLLSWQRKEESVKDLCNNKKRSFVTIKLKLSITIM